MFADYAGGASYGDFKSGDPPPSNGERKKRNAFRGLPFARQSLFSRGDI